MNSTDIKLALEQRGAFLNRGVEISAAIQMAKTKGVRIDPYILSIFSKFNGFQEGALDPGSGVRIWPLEDVLDNLSEGQRRVSFADFLINSNEYTFDIEDSEAPIFLDEEQMPVAENFPDF